MDDRGFTSVLMAFTDKNQFGTGDWEDESRTGSFPLESDDSESLDEESPDDEEEELSEEELAEEMKPFTVADWKQEIPDYTVEEFEEKLPDRTRSRWMAPVVSCLFGTLLGAAIAGVLVNDQPKPQQARAFFSFFLVFALLFSCIWYWLSYLRIEQVARKMKKLEANPEGSEQSIPNEGFQQENPAGSEPIHPK
jgi:hypothetical protein